MQGGYRSGALQGLCIMFDSVNGSTAFMDESYRQLTGLFRLSLAKMFIYMSPGPAVAAHCATQTCCQWDLYLAFVTNFSVRSSIRLLFFSLEEERKIGFKQVVLMKNCVDLSMVKLYFPSIETYGSSASAILSRSHVLDSDGCVHECQSCAAYSSLKRPYRCFTAAFTWINR